MTESEIDRLLKINDILITELREQRVLWTLIEADIKLIDDMRFKVRFMEFHDPIGRIDRTLNSVDNVYD